MSLETTLREYSVGLTSERITDRKKAAENIKNVLTGNAAPSVLSDNTFKKRGYCWNNLFEDVHEYLLKEVEKSHATKTFESQVKPLATSLLHIVVAGSIKGKAYINCETITNACLLVLKNKQTLKIIGDTYLSLLFKYVVSQQHYVGHISPQTLEDLLDVSITACDCKHLTLDYLTRLRLVLLHIQTGTKSCQFINPLRDALPRLEKCFSSSVTDKKIQEVLIDIAVTLLSTLSTECRQTMCEFTESITSVLLQFYDQNADYKKKVQLLKALAMAVVLHHPRGRLESEKGSLAYNWDNWNKVLRGIMELIYFESIFLQKSFESKFRAKTGVSYDNSHFYFLAATVYYQMFNKITDKENDESDVSSSSKRQKISMNRNKSINDVIEEFKFNHVPWLGVIAEYVNHYGHTITEAENVTVLSIVESYLSNHNDKICWDLISQLFSFVLKRITSTSHVDLLISIWNACVRHSTSSQSHSAMHDIIQALLLTKIVDATSLQGLMKLYLEHAMPITDSSVKTLSFLLCSHFTIYNTLAYKTQLFNWFIEKQNFCTNTEYLQDLFLRLLSTDNLDLNGFNKAITTTKHDLFFNSIEDCILFSEFEVEFPNTQVEAADKKHKRIKNIDIDKNVKELLDKQLNAEVKKLVDKLGNKQICLTESSNYLRTILVYIDILIKTTHTTTEVGALDLYASLKIYLKIFFDSVTSMIKNAKGTAAECDVLIKVHETLCAKYEDFLQKEVRKSMAPEFFHSIHNKIDVNVTQDTEDISMQSDEIDADYLDVRHYCILILSAYCRSDASYRQEILDLILDPKLYKFTNNDDIELAFQTISTLHHESVENPPLESTFSFMQRMCKSLFRNSKATGRLLSLLLLVIDKIWAMNSTVARENCSIMIDGYLARCQKLYYSPDVAALIYECLVKMEVQNRKHVLTSKANYVDLLMQGTRGDVHSLRMYCTYLLNEVASTIAPKDIQSIMNRSLELFKINISDDNERVLKDESLNRTLTLLHIFYSIAQTNSSLIKNIFIALLKVHKEKALNRVLLKKVLNKIAHFATNEGFEEYWDRDILGLLHFWFSSKYNFADLPFSLLGYVNIDSFLVDSNIKWLVPAEILWCKDGNIESSAVMPIIMEKSRSTKEGVIEMCFCYIIVLCLPYIVIEKYRLPTPYFEKQSVYIQSCKNANRLYHATRQVLGNDKWSNIFVESMGELVLLTASHLADSRKASDMFDAHLPRPTETYYYGEEIFAAMLKYYGELIDGDIMQYLCQNQPLAISKIVVKLWKFVLERDNMDHRCLSLHTYLTMTEAIPQNYPSDSFVTKYVCNSILHAIEKTKNRTDLKLYIETLKRVLNKFLPSQSQILKGTVPRAVSLLMIKKEEGFEVECRSLLENLVTSVDEADGVNVLSQNIMKQSQSACFEAFKETLTSYVTSLACPSVEILTNMKEFLSANNKYVVRMWKEIDTKMFSEECATSLLHKAINNLNHILSIGTDNLTLIETSNCLSEIGTYEMKTLVMTAPPDSGKAVELKPVQYFTVKVLKCLENILFDPDPSVVSHVMLTLARLLKYKEGKQAIDLDETQPAILKPFLPSSSSSFVPTKFQIIDSRFQNYSKADFWVPGDSAHSIWVTKITTTLLDVVSTGANYVSSLYLVCKCKPKLCREILPSLVGLILTISNETQIQCIGIQINNFLDFVWSKSFNESDSQRSCYGDDSLNITHDLKLIIEDVLKVIDLVRLQRTHYSKRSEEFETLNYLRLEYDKVAWCAAAAGDSLSALYYGELWAFARHRGFPPASPEALLNLDGGENMQGIFRKCFKSIGDLDASEGCGSGHLTSEAEKRRHLIDTGQYPDALLLHDIALSSDADSKDFDLQYGVVRSLHKAGMHHLALQYMKAMPENERLDDIKYECLACLGDWSVFVDTQEVQAKSVAENSNMVPILKSLRYACLKNCLTLDAAEQFELKLESLLNTSKIAVSKLCRKLNMDNCQSVYSVVSNLQLLNDIEAYVSVRCGKQALACLLDRWSVNKLPKFQDFRYLEPLISQRGLILEHAQNTYTNMRSDILNVQLRYAELGLSNERVQLSQRLLAIAKKCHSSVETDLVESQICWVKEHKDIALSLVQGVTLSKSKDTRMKAVALRQYGTWQAECRYENPREIIDKYLKKSLEVLGREHQDVQVKVYTDLANYADAEYKQVVAYMKSWIFEEKVKCLESMKGTASSLRSTQQELNKDERKALFTNERLSALDEAEINDTIAEKQQYLELAMRYYLLSLSRGEAGNLCVFRVISLWLDTPQLSFPGGVAGAAGGDGFSSLLAAVPSRKFVPALPQLAPRLTNDNTNFDRNLNDIMTRCAKEHPHHTLPILFGIKNSDKDNVILNASASVRGNRNSLGPPEPRTAAAASLIEKLADKDTRMGKIIQQMEILCNALISFANYTAKTKEVRQSVPKSELIHNIRNLDRVPVPTVTLPIRHDNDYSDIPTVISFPDKFELVGGINCPKKMICKGSDGVDRTLLLKGEDDLRQDAVMQQVFNIVNTLLKVDPNTSRNNLSIRTYKVVALSRRSGVVEWCCGTIPLGVYLVGTPGKPGAHQRYRPQDISHTAARKLLSTYHEKGRSNAEKLAAFQKILREFKPVLHYFFTEHYLDPVTWYERRQSYTKSVAVSSMIGYVLGLGDRHLQNILIDKKTAEVVHIDFGIAFDQGKALPTPETVPFRLTQDIVAGFGPSGVEGLFRRSCERSMIVMRAHREALLTILEVLLCDPLLTARAARAAATQRRGNTVQQTSSSASSGLAARALLAASSKLSGAAGGAAGGASPRGHVAQLIREATDNARLARLYPGWQPYL